MATAADKAKTNGEPSEPSASAILTVEAIIAAKDLTEEVVEVPEWGGSVKVRSFSKKGQQQVRELATVNDEIDPERLEMFMFIHGVIDPSFTDDTFELLRDKNAGVIDRILQRIMSISGMDADALARAQEKFPNQS